MIDKPVLDRSTKYERESKKNSDRLHSRQAGCPGRLKTVVYE